MSTIDELRPGAAPVVRKKFRVKAVTEIDVSIDIMAESEADAKKRAMSFFMGYTTEDVRAQEGVTRSCQVKTVKQR